MLYQYYNSEDMDQLILFPKKEDLDDSIKLLAKRTRRSRASQIHTQIISRAGKKFHYIPIYPQLSSDHQNGEIQDYDSFEASVRNAEEQEKKNQGVDEKNTRASNFDISSLPYNVDAHRLYIRKLRINHLDNIDF